MSDDDLRPLDRGRFRKIIGQHPRVTELKRSVDCQGFMATGFSFKRQREGTLPRCKKPARWSFEHLRTHHRFFSERAGRTPRSKRVHYCWSHLIYRGVFGGMEEEAATYRWLRAIGYRTPDDKPLIGEDH